MNKLKLTALSIVCAGLLTGCNSTVQPIKQFELKELKYTQKPIQKDIAFAVAKPQIIIKNKISESIERGLHNRLVHNTNKLACHLKTELEKLMIAKGITISGRFEGLNEMTFTQKRETSALFYPEIIIDITENSTTTYQGQITVASKGNLIANAKVNIVVLEPLSKEKIWIKGIDVSSIEEKINYKGAVQSNGNHAVVDTKLIKVAESLDKLLVNINDKILKEANKHIDIEEFRFLNDDIKKLKQIKRY